MKIYKNGVLAETLNLGSNPSHVTDNSHPNIHVGAIRSGGTGNPIEEYSGGIDELAIWQRALNQDEILQIYAGGAGVATNTIYFEGGICKCPNATVGDVASINGTVYTAVDNSTIKSELDSGNGNLCTTLVTQMTGGIANSAYYGLVTSTFNKDISFWDTSNVTSFFAMFWDAHSFNQDISNWDTSSATNMSGMFVDAQAFNQDIGKWDVSNVTNMGFMLADMDNFNQNLSGWDTSKVTNMYQLFQNNTDFNQDISYWDVSKVGNMGSMFLEQLPLIRIFPIGA